MSEHQADEVHETPYASIEEFLATCPPGKTVKFYFGKIAHHNDISQYEKIVYELQNARFYCPNEACKREQIFKPEEHSALGGPYFVVSAHQPSTALLHYVCRNCDETQKKFAILTTPRHEQQTTIMKIGEHPAFGAPTPSVIFKLIGRDRNMFVLGWRAERQGMGIGAFAYYRRIIENQKDVILTETRNAVETLNPTSPLIAELEAAKKETQFTRAIDSIKHTLPDGLLIKGHNPLTLLHSALSKGIHELSNDECLQLATAARTVLTDLSERIAHIRRDNTEINAAVSVLLSVNAKK